MEDSYAEAAGEVLPDPVDFADQFGHHTDLAGLFQCVLRPVPAFALGGALPAPAACRRTGETIYRAEPHNSGDGLRIPDGTLGARRERRTQRRHPAGGPWRAFLPRIWAAFLGPDPEQAYGAHPAVGREHLFLRFHIQSV